jgi:hypothetical protein
MGTFIAQDPMPELILEDGQPTPRLAAWMDRRFSSQRVIFEAQGWRSVRDELRSLANSATTKNMVAPTLKESHNPHPNNHLQDSPSKTSEKSLVKSKNHSSPTKQSTSRMKFS